VSEDRLNTTYAPVMAKAPPKMREGYRKMQHDWIAYRHTRRKDWPKPSTPIVDKIISCMLDATARQALILDDELLDLSE
jgi:uncharacterized protein YecT (DUF1311 family)